MKKAYVVKLPVKIASIPQAEEKIQSGMVVLKKYLTVMVKRYQSA